jgi:hypothetical protein
VSIEVKDSNGNDVAGKTVPVNTIVNLYGYYEDLSGTSQAEAKMDVYFDPNGSGFNYKGTLFSDVVNDGDTVIKPYTLTELGTYEFRWTCTKSDPGSSSGTFCSVERAQARTIIQLVVPEPGTMAIVVMALSTVSFLAIKRFRAK